VAENFLSTNVAPVHWASGVSITAPKEDDGRSEKHKSAKRERAPVPRSSEPAAAGEETESSHELDSFA
jgi:hypothetical protein